MTVKILGIDPGSRISGYAILENHDHIFSAVCCNVIRLTDEDDPLSRLTMLYSRFSDLISEHKPDYCAIETPVYGKDPLAMLKLGRAQAAIIMAILHKQVPLFEYYPKAVKKAITGSGNATKNQVAFMLSKLINNTGDSLPTDATDALAVAWCHFQKLRYTENTSDHNSSGSQKPRRNTWRSFVENNPERIRNS